MSLKTCLRYSKPRREGQIMVLCDAIFDRLSHLNRCTYERLEPLEVLSDTHPKVRGFGEYLNEYMLLKTKNVTQNLSGGVGFERHFGVPMRMISSHLYNYIDIYSLSPKARVTHTQNLPAAGFAAGGKVISHSGLLTPPPPFWVLPGGGVLCAGHHPNIHERFTKNPHFAFWGVLDHD